MDPYYYTKKLTNILYDVAADTKEALTDYVESYSSDAPCEDEEKVLPFSVKALQGLQRLELFKLFSEHPDPKVLVIEKALAGPFLRCITTIEELNSFDVQEVCYLDNVNAIKKSHHYVFLFRPTDGNFINLERILTNSSKAKYTVCHPAGLNLLFFAMDERLLSMEQPNMLKITGNMENSNVCSVPDNLALYAVADRIAQLQKTYGAIPNVQGFGENAEKLADIILKQPHTSDTLFARLTIYDRNEDLLTPCFTPMTFESQIDELFGITGQVTEIEKKKIMQELHQWLNIKPKDDDSKKIGISLNNEIYSKLKNISLYNLNETFDSLKKEYQRKKDDLKDLLKQTKETGSQPAIEMAIDLARDNKSDINHIATYHNIFDCIMASYNASLKDCEDNLALRIHPELTLKFIETGIVKKTPINQILKLLSLFSQIHGPIDPVRFQKISLRMLDSYGNSSQAALKCLKKSGMLSSINYKEKNRELHLNKTHKKVKDISSIYGGYSPLSVRHIEKLLKSPLSVPHEGLELVLFLGGCTRAEASACQLLSKNIVVITTGIFTSNTFMDAVIAQ